MKKSIACGACRTSKRRCIHSGQPPCFRCKERGEECIFPPKGTSFIFRRTRLERQSRPSSNDSGPAPSSSIAIRSAGENATGPNLQDTNPFEYMTDEVKNSYLRCSYKWSFHHIPSLLNEILRGSLDAPLVWAMLAISVRFSQDAPVGFSSQIEASNAFAAHTRALILPTIDQPSLHRIQVLLMLTGHSWGAGEGRRAWVYLGMAVRMAQVMGLLEESATSVTRDDFIAAEERRRTAWTCFLMDSLLSGGKGRTRSLTAAAMHIQLPCDSESFNFGEPVACEMIDGSKPSPALHNPAGALGIVAYSMRVADIWGEVARWACSSHSKDHPPWRPESEFQQLLARLEAWRGSLPPRLRFSVFLLHAHTVSNQGQAYCYMHCIYFMSVMFLYRSCLPEVEMQKAGKEDPESARWSSWSSKELAKVADQVCELLQEMRGFGLFFLRGLVPWIGFTIYSAVGTLLYFYHFPDSSDSEGQVEKWRQRIIDGCVFLKDMRKAWPMADNWRETIKTMQIFYSNIKTQGEQAVTPQERREMRNAIIDYGALQPSPVLPSEIEDSNDNPKSLADDMVDESVNLDPIQIDLMAPADTDLFDTHFELDSDMHASFADATQEFWESFPGAMEI
ncbi:transcriptional regulatory protein [Paramyrothecium foliicola]|nr:transcriptional regulatory protein [Paramyrothecium foliicola]